MICPGGPVIYAKYKYKNVWLCACWGGGRNFSSIWHTRDANAQAAEHVQPSCPKGLIALIDSASVFPQYLAHGGRNCTGCWASPTLLSERRNCPHSSLSCISTWYRDVTATLVVHWMATYTRRLRVSRAPCSPSIGKFCEVLVQSVVIIKRRPVPLFTSITWRSERIMTDRNFKKEVILDLAVVWRRCGKLTRGSIDNRR